MGNNTQPQPGQKAFVIVDLLFGDNGKGATVDYLTAKDSASLVIRYNGGAQAAHWVVDDQLRCHCFSQFGAGTLTGAKTYLSRFMRVNPLALIQESKHLEQLMGETNLLSWISLDKRCLITTPFHVQHSRRVAARHRRGTCGMGVGETQRYADQFGDAALTAGDLRDRALMLDKLKRLAVHYDGNIDQGWIETLCNAYAWVAHQVNVTTEADWQTLRQDYKTLIFEGAQGVGLDKDRGFKPYVSYSNTTTEQAMTLLEGFNGQITKIGVLRMYGTRHGPGPFPTEEMALRRLPEIHNRDNSYQGRVRRGWMDAELIRQFITITGDVDYLALSHLDYFSKMPEWKIGLPRDRWQQPDYWETSSEQHYLDFINQQIAPIGILSRGARRKDKTHYEHFSFQ